MLLKKVLLFEMIFFVQFPNVFQIILSLFIYLLRSLGNTQDRNNVLTLFAMILCFTFNSRSKKLPTKPELTTVLYEILRMLLSMDKNYSLEYQLEKRTFHKQLPFHLGIQANICVGMVRRCCNKYQLRFLMLFICLSNVNLIQ